VLEAIDVLEEAGLPASAALIRPRFDHGRRRAAARRRRARRSSGRSPRRAASVRPGRSSVAKSALLVPGRPRLRAVHAGRIPRLGVVVFLRAHALPFQAHRSCTRAGGDFLSR
jgi:hypothetical protein